MDNNPPVSTNASANTQQQVIDRLKQANNVLVTVKSNPSVDQLAACIGLTLMLNKLSKHATAVFSGEVPSTIEFLKPEATLEKNTDSLRDFIIALDKSKADKLRYKIEDKVVKIFITPYRASISDKDLEFSQGDFNIDVVVALGVHKQQDLDQAITSHGRILHDATVISVNNTKADSIGNMNWVDPAVSSLSELVTLLDGQLSQDSVLDSQIATALLTGIVAETDRFSNDKTSSQTMTISAKLMAAGANQQLVATKLEGPEPAAKVSDTLEPRSSVKQVPPPAKPVDDGAIKIDHDLPPIAEDVSVSNAELDEPQIHIDDEGTIHHVNDQISEAQPPAGPGVNVTGGSPMMIKPPTWNSQLTANSQPEGFEQGQEAVTDPLSLPSAQPALLSHTDESSQLTTLPGLATPPVATDVPPPVDSARSAVEAAAATEPSPLTPRFDLNAQPTFGSIHNPEPGAEPLSAPTLTPVPGFDQNNLIPNVGDHNQDALDMPRPQVQLSQPGYDEDVPSGAPPTANPPASDTLDDSPPPVPPPMVPPVF